MYDSARSLWSACLGRLQLEIPRSSYDTWLKHTTGLALEGGRLLVGVPTAFAAEWLERRLLPAIQRVVDDVAGGPLQVSFQVASAHRSAPIMPPSPVAAPAAVSEEEDEGPLVSGPNSAGVVAINPRFSFDAFVVGEGNQLAYAAATSVAQHPGEQYNPLFIYSGVGLGKTHLLHAIANEAIVRDRLPMYVTSEQFTSDFVRSIRDRTQEEFRTKYRKPDVLLIDDIQFLEGKEQTQVGFFHTFNELHNANRQIVITCDRPPSAVHFLADRLRSRFQGGLVADIQPPDVETRSAILHKKAERAHVKLDQEIVQLIARTPTASIRELEGCLNKVIALANFMGKAITRDLVSDALGPTAIAAGNRAVATPERALQIVARHYGTSVQDLCARPPDRKTTEAMRTAMYLLTHVAKVSPQRAAELLGNWNVRTVSNSTKAVAQRLAEDADYRAIVDKLTAQL